MYILLLHTPLHKKLLIILIDYTIMSAVIILNIIIEFNIEGWRSHVEIFGQRSFVIDTVVDTSNFLIFAVVFIDVKTYQI